mgnify:CR=1 FL=1
MKKILMMAFLCSFLLVIFFPVSSFAQPQIYESPDIRIIINGEQKEYEVVPLIVNGRTMLPLRAILNDLGIDDDHILWNNDEKSVTFNNESTVVYMKIGSSTAVFNEKEIMLDASPLLYKSRTYVPARFISESLGKKVLWNNFSRSVIICDNEYAQRNADILRKANEAMNALNKLKFAMSLFMQVKDNNLVMNISTDMIYEVDKINKIIYSDAVFNMPFIGEVNQENYILRGCIFQKISGDHEWEKVILTEEKFESNFEGAGDVLGGIYSDEMTYSSLLYSENKETGEFVLKGRVDSEKMLEMINKTETAGNMVQTENLEYESVFAEIYINPVNWHVNKMIVDFTGKIKQMGNYAQFNAKAVITFKYDDFIIEVPDSIMQKLQN